MKQQWCVEISSSGVNPGSTPIGCLLGFALGCLLGSPSRSSSGSSSSSSSSGVCRHQQQWGEPWINTNEAGCALLGFGLGCLGLGCLVGLLGNSSSGSSRCSSGVCRDQQQWGEPWINTNEAGCTLLSFGLGFLGLGSLLAFLVVIAAAVGAAAVAVVCGQ